MTAVVAVHVGGGATSASLNVAVGSPSPVLLRVCPQLRFPAFAVLDLPATSCSSAHAWIGRSLPPRSSSVGSPSSGASSSSTSHSFLHPSLAPPPPPPPPPPPSLRRHHHQNHHHHHHPHHGAGRNTVSSWQVTSAIDARAMMSATDHMALVSVVELGECHVAEDLRVSGGTDVQLDTASSDGSSARTTATANAKAKAKVPTNTANAAKPDVMVTRQLVVVREDGRNAPLQSGGHTGEQDGRGHGTGFLQLEEKRKQKMVSSHRAKGNMSDNLASAMGEGGGGGGGGGGGRGGGGATSVRRASGFAANVSPFSLPSHSSIAGRSVSSSTSNLSAVDKRSGDRLLLEVSATRSSSSGTPMVNVKKTDGRRTAMLSASVDTPPATAPFIAERAEEDGEGEEGSSSIAGLSSSAPGAVILVNGQQGSSDLSRATSSSSSSSSSPSLGEEEESVGGGEINTERRKGRGRRFNGVKRMNKREPLPPWSQEYCRSKEEEMVKSILKIGTRLDDLADDDDDADHEVVGGEFYGKRRKGHVESVLNSWLGRVTRVELTNVFRELGRLHHIDCSLDVFSWMTAQKGRLKPNAHAYISMISLLGRSAMVDKAQQLFEEMEEKGIEKTTYAYNAMIGALIQGRREKEAWALFLRMRREARQAPAVKKNNGKEEEMTTPTTSPSAATTGKIDGPEKEEEEELSKVQVKADKAAVMGVVDDGESSSDGIHARESSDVKKTSRDSCCAPDCVTYNSILKYCANVKNHGGSWQQSRSSGESRTRGRNSRRCRRRRVGEGGGGGGGENQEGEARGALWAIDLLRGMTDDGVEPNVITYNTVISACRHDGLYLEAMEIFREMEEKGISPDVVTYNTLIDVCAKAKLCDEASNLLDEMKLARVAPNLMTYTTLIGAYGSAGRPEDAQRVFDELVERAGGASSSRASSAAGDMAYSSSSSSLFPRRGARGGMADSSDLVVKPPDVVTWTLMMDAYGRAGMAGKAAQVFRQMRTNGIRPTLLTWTSLMRAHGLVGDCDEATHVFNEMQRAGETVDITVINILLDAYGKNGQWTHAAALYNALYNRCHASSSGNAGLGSSSAVVFQHPNGTSRATASSSTTVVATPSHVSSTYLSSALTTTPGGPTSSIGEIGRLGGCRDASAALRGVSKSLVRSHTSRGTAMSGHDGRDHGRMSHVVVVSDVSAAVLSVDDRRSSSSSSSSSSSTTSPSSSTSSSSLLEGEQPTESAASHCRGNILAQSGEYGERHSPRSVVQPRASDHWAGGGNDGVPAAEFVVLTDDGGGPGYGSPAAAASKNGRSNSNGSSSLHGSNFSAGIAADSRELPVLSARNPEEEAKGCDDDNRTVDRLLQCPEQQRIGGEEEHSLCSSIATSSSSCVGASSSRRPSGEYSEPESGGGTRPAVPSWKVRPSIARVAVRPNVATFNTMINAFYRAGRLKEALHVEKQMAASGCNPDHITIALLARALDELGLHRRADELRKSARRGRRR